MSSPIETCTVCVMDSTAAGISFDENGRCNLCSEFETMLGRDILFSGETARNAELSKLAARVRDDGKGKPYDCIVGVSGGVDSSWALVQAVQLGLRPLAVHMDNGWNTELAVSNIANLIDKLKVDLFTYVIDWSEYRDLMQAFFDADVIDVELLYDNAMWAVCYEQASRYKLKYILSGSNLSTEGLPLPANWRWRNKWDARNIRAIAKSGGVKVRTFPLFSTLDWLRHQFIHGRRWVPFLDFVDYRKDAALQALVEQYDYKPYPYKHYESVFTRFYQGYLLPEKFGVDKRKLHLSALIITGQMQRSEAVVILNELPYPNPDDLVRDRDYFLKKMNWESADLDTYLERPERSHDDWPTDRARTILLAIGRMTRRFRSGQPDRLPDN